jgi:hypothetical protein
MCEPIISDHGIVHETPAASGDQLSECAVVSKIPNNSDYIFKTMFFGVSEWVNITKNDQTSTAQCQKTSDFSKYFILLIQVYCMKMILDSLIVL